MVEWAKLLGGDPRPWSRSSDEPSARRVVATHVDEKSNGDPAVVAAHGAVLNDSVTEELLGRVFPWGSGPPVSGHNSPGFVANLLHLLADMGLQGGDDDRTEAVLDAFLALQDDEGRFEAYGMVRGKEREMWGSLACDHHTITDALVRFGRGSSPGVKRALGRMTSDLTDTAQGSGWLCSPHTVSGFRGPGRKADVCPQVTLEAARSFSRVPPDQRPEGLDATVRTSISVWSDRLNHKPYMFGHGRRFNKVKWPTFWYDVHWVLDTVGRYPDTWALGPERRSVAEMAACLIAYNFGDEGRVTPR